MIEKLLPLTENKLRILREIYDSGGTHLLELSKKLGLHPFSAQKTLSTLPFVEKKKSGKTIVLKIDENSKEIIELLFILEDYKLGTSDKKARQAINALLNVFSGDKNILSCCIFGSYARGAAAEESDIDLLFIVKAYDEKILKSCRDISSVLGREVSPLVVKEREFFESLKAKEPTIEALLAPSQRLIIMGKEYFLRNTRR